MHPELLEIIRNRRLGRAARDLLLYVYGYTNGTLEAELPVDQVLADLELTEGSLRRLRKDLEGWMRSRQRGEVLECEIEQRTVGRYERAENEHSWHLDAQKMRDDERAENARNAQKMRETEAEERAENEHSVKRGERENLAHARIWNSLNREEGGYTSSLPDGRVREEPGRTLRLLCAAGIDPASATEIAGRLTLAEAARHVAVYQLDLAAKRVKGPGVLLFRLRNRPVPPLPDWEAMRAGVLAEHITAADLEAWGLVDPYAAPAGMKYVHGRLVPSWWREEDDQED